MRTNYRTFPEAEVVPLSQLAPLDCPEIFGRVAPLEVDLGCGDGNFLVASAANNPARNFLGIERLAGRVRAACRKVGDGSLTNVRILRFDILHTVQQLIPRRSVDVFHLMFPDPWPKRRHAGRRIMSEEFLHALSRGLKAEGTLQIATDDAEYFAAMQTVIARVPAFTVVPSNEIDPLPASTFEERFRATGAMTHRLGLRKIAELR